jgi:hypothetical protein
MYVAAVDRALFLGEVREHKRIPRVKSLFYASLDGKERGLQLHYEVAAQMRDEKIVVTYDEILLAKLVDDDRWIEPRWIVEFGGSLLEEMQKERLVYEAEIRSL